VDSGEHVAFFKLFEEDGKMYIRLCLGEPETGEETVIFPDIDFRRDKDPVFAFTPDGKYVALMDGNLTMCDIWLHDRERIYNEPIRLTELEQFDPRIPVEDLYALGMAPEDVLTIKQMEFSPDGKKLIMTFGILGKTAIWMYEIDRDHYRQMTPDRTGYYPSWFPDGERFVYTKLDSVSGVFSEDLLIMKASTNESEYFVTSTNNENLAKPSPDGKYVAFVEKIDNVWNASVARVSDGKVVRFTDQPDEHGCGAVLWNADGTKLYVAIGGYGKIGVMSLCEIPFDEKLFDR
jgi:Tol biopolymer transport system component